MKQYSGWQAPYMAFYSPAFYQEVGKFWSGFAWLYLLLLAVFSALVLAVQTQFLLVPQLQMGLEKIMDPMPSIKIENGRLSIDKPSPYFVSLDDKTLGLPKRNAAPSRPLTIVFDTREKPVEISEFKDVVLVTADKIRIFTTSSSVKKDETIDFQPNTNVDLNKKSVTLMANSYLKWLGPVMFLAVCIPTIIFWAMQTLIYAALMKLAAGGELSYPTIVRLSSVALTPVIIVELICRLAGVHVPFWWLISIMIALGYLYFAVDANKTSTNVTI